MQTYCLLSLVIAAIAALPSAAEDFCDNRISIGTAQTAYKSRGDRCEGLFDRPASTGFYPIDTISLVVDSTSWDTQTDSVPIGWSVPPVASEVSLRASSIPGLALFYRMDTRRPSQDGVFRWKTNLVRMVELSPRNIGIIAWQSEQIGGVAREVLLPVWLNKKPTNAQTSYSVLLTTTLVLQKLDLTVRKIQYDGGYGEIVGQSTFDTQPMVPSRPIGPITLPGPTAPGLYHVLIRAQLMNPPDPTDATRKSDFVFRTSVVP